MDDDSTVYLLDRRVKEIAESGVAGIRDKVIRRLPEERISSVRVDVTGAPPVAITRRGEGESPAPANGASEAEARGADAPGNEASGNGASGNGAEAPRAGAGEIPGADLPGEVGRIARTWRADGPEVEPYQLENFFQELRTLRANRFDQTIEVAEASRAARLEIRLDSGEELTVTLRRTEDGAYQVTGSGLPQDAVVLPWRARRLTLGLLQED